MIKRKNLISAEVVADSVHAGSGKRITTFILTLPRIVLAEFNTHRAFSRNSGSSRAIPFKRMKESVKKNLFIPLAFQKHHSGMQGSEYHKTDSFKDKLLVFLWWFASKLAIFSATLFYKFGATKQLANRILEPFMWHTVIFTTTEFEGFFRQRCPQYVTPVGGKNDDGSDWKYRSQMEVYENHSNPDNIRLMGEFKTTDWLNLNQGSAEIHISLAAEAIYDALQNSTVDILQEGEWHIPFHKEIDEYISKGIQIKDAPYISEPLNRDQILIYVSTALCAMVSFTEVGGKSLFEKINPDANIKLHYRLVKDEHMSPTEHCAQVSRKLKPGEHSNFKGNWLQYRKIVEKNLHR